MKPKTTYEEHPDFWDDLARRGMVNLATMARFTFGAADMSSKLGYDKSSVGHWVSGKNGVSRRSERMAGAWLAASAPQRFAKSPAESADTKAPEPAADPPVEQGEVMLLVVAPTRASAEKLKRLAALLACAAEEV